MSYMSGYSKYASNLTRHPTAKKLNQSFLRRTLLHSERLDATVSPSLPTSSAARCPRLGRQSSAAFKHLLLPLLAAGERSKHS